MAEPPKIAQAWEKERDKRAANSKRTPKVKKANIIRCRCNDNKFGLLLEYATNDYAGLVGYDRRFIALACSNCINPFEGDSGHLKLFY